jgi:large subunit ribosomal protein L25
MDLELTLDARDAQGKANKRLRRAGIVPGVVYGKGEPSTNVQVDAKTFETLYKSAGRTSVIKFRLPGHSRATSGFIKSVQRHPLSGQPLHVDYLLVNLKQEMEVDVPLVFTGEAPAVEETGGALLHNLSSIHVKALPTDIPHEVTVDVSVLKSLDVAIHVRDLNLNRDLVQVLTDPTRSSPPSFRLGSRRSRSRFSPRARSWRARPPRARPPRARPPSANVPKAARPREPKARRRPARAPRSPDRCGVRNCPATRRPDRTSPGATRRTCPAPLTGSPRRRAPGCSHGRRRGHPRR